MCYCIVKYTMTRTIASLYKCNLSLYSHIIEVVLYEVYR